MTQFRTKYELAAGQIPNLDRFMEIVLREGGELDRRREILRTLSSAQAPAIPQYRSTATLRSKSLGELRRLEDELLAHDRLNVFVIAESEEARMS
jgi:hypothetical protein